MIPPRGAFACLRRTRRGRTTFRCLLAVLPSVAAQWPLLCPSAFLPAPPHRCHLAPAPTPSWTRNPFVCSLVGCLVVCPEPLPLTDADPLCGVSHQMVVGPAQCSGLCGPSSIRRICASPAAVPYLLDGRVLYRTCSVPVCVSDASVRVSRSAHLISRAAGGQGLAAAERQDLMRRLQQLMLDAIPV